MKKIILTLTILFISTNISFASKLPDNLWNYIKGQIPSATQRFDSVITVSKNIMYVPLYPAQREDVENLSIEYTYPKSKTLKEMPEVVIFNNNFVLLKVFKDKDGNYTITKNEDLPLKVKLGVMPQDMLVPAGLKIPESLNLILGDLVIPSVADTSLIVYNKEGKETKITPLEGQILANDLFEKGNFKELNELKNKKAYVTSNGSKFINVYDETSINPLYELKLSSLPLKIAASNPLKTAVIIYFNSKNIEIIDLQTEQIMTSAELEGNPKDILFDDGKNIAYISVPSINGIYVMEIPSARLLKLIKVAQAPSKIAMSCDKKTMAYIDQTTQDMYLLELDDSYSSRFIAKTKNASGIAIDDDFVYVVSRTQNMLSVFNKQKGSIEKEIITNKKPTDIYFSKDKIFILCAQDGVIDVYDVKTGKIVKKIELDKKGFYSNLTKVPGEQVLLVTGYDTQKFAVFDIEKTQITKKRDLDIQVSNIIIIDK